MKLPPCDTAKQHADLLKTVNEHQQMHHMLRIVLDTFGRTDGVLVTVQTKQQVLQNIRELLERVEHD